MAGGESYNDCMADRNAFYQAIWASPDDDLPRLVFADWLDENDDPDAAAFLRLLSACRTCPPDVDRLRPLVAELRRAMVRLSPEFVENACPVHPAVVIGPWVDVDHGANRKVLEFIHSRRRSRIGVQVPAEALPVRPGLHAVWEEWPVKRLWEELNAALTPGSACAIDGTPALVDVWSGVVLAVATLASFGLPTLQGTWHYAGPFDNQDGAGFEAQYPPEKGVDLKAEYLGKGAEKVGWKEWKGFQLGRVIDLMPLCPNSPSQAVIYLYHEFDSAAAVKLPIALGSDDTLSVFFNGKRIYHEAHQRPAAPDQDFVELDVKKGKNQLLIKICQGGGEWAAYVAPYLP